MAAADAAEPFVGLAGMRLLCARNVELWLPESLARWPERALTRAPLLEGSSPGQQLFDRAPTIQPESVLSE